MEQEARRDKGKKATGGKLVGKLGRQFMKNDAKPWHERSSIHPPRLISFLVTKIECEHAKSG